MPAINPTIKRLKLLLQNAIDEGKDARERYDLLLASHNKSMENVKGIQQELYATRGERDEARTLAINLTQANENQSNEIMRLRARPTYAAQPPQLIRSGQEDQSLKQQGAIEVLRQIIEKAMWQGGTGANE